MAQRTPLSFNSFLPKLTSPPKEFPLEEPHASKEDKDSRISLCGSAPFLSVSLVALCWLESLARSLQLFSLYRIHKFAEE